MFSRRLMAVVLLFAMAAALLTGCAGEQPTPTAPSTLPLEEPPTLPPTEPSTEPPTEPAPVYRNPLNGRILEEPYTGRPFGFSISNTPDVLPHVNLCQADVVFESFVNNSVVRLFALYTDPAKIDNIGPIRSIRIISADITQHYGVIAVHAGGSDLVRALVRDMGIDNFNIDTWDGVQFGASIRDPERRRKVGMTHSLLAVGPQMAPFGESNGITVTGEPDKDYGFRFREDGTPADGEIAENITISLTFAGMHKVTQMDYDPQMQSYVFSQYGKVMTDWYTGEPETFTNVMVLFASMDLYNGHWYQTVDFLAGGEGYFACGGRLIPIRWGCEGDEEPLWFTTMDGQPLEIGEGNTYIAITIPDSPVDYGPAEAAEE